MVILSFRKGINISLKKIDCISAVNTLPGDPLNFPDLDIANLLLDTATTVSNGRSSLSSNLSVEIGRKSMLIGTPFSTSSSNALQGSDFAAVISDSDFGSLNDHDDMPYSEDFSLALRPAFKDRITSDNLTFQVPELLARQKRRLKRFKNALMDHELMLEKDQLFINQQGMLNYSGAELLSNISDPIMEALKLLNGPEYIFIPGTFDSIFTSNRLKFSYSKKKPIIAGLVVNDDNQYPPDSDNGNYHDDFNDIEAYRNDANSISSSTPSNLVLPWSTSSSSFSSSHSTFLDKHGGVSSILNTPIRKGGNNTPSPLTDLTDLKLSSSSSSTSFSSTSSAIFGNTQTSSMSQETFDFFYYLVDSITSKSGSLSSILKREYTSRPIAARALHHLLELRSANLIEVEQNCPFADIKISIIQ